MDDGYSVSEIKAAARLAAKIRHEPNGCWIFTGSIVAEGYGQIWFEGRPWRAHRLAYKLLVGPPPEGRDLDHLCRNRACVNPDHLEPVTHRENLLRGEGPTAVNARKTCCISGHAYTPENTYIRPNGSRACRVCLARRTAAYRARSQFKRSA